MRSNALMKAPLLDRAGLVARTAGPLLALLALLCAHLPAKAAESGYLLQPGDLIMVSVWKEPEMQAEILIRPDGGLSFPLAGDIMAAGKSIQQLTTLLEDKLRPYIPKPVITVALRQIGGNRIYVLGQVNRPGEFPFVRPLDVMQALALAGGTNSFADLGSIQILRRDAEGQQSAIRFQYGEVGRGRSLQQNILLQSGDTVVVP
jgi:polysaccharide export outer membrane protein